MERIPARDVQHELVHAWNRLTDSNPALGSPYFAPEYARLMGQVRQDGFVLVCEDGADVVGLLPLQRSSARIGRPLGGPMSDYQALIAAAGTRIDARALLAGAGLEVLLFDHWHGTQTWMRPFTTTVARSTYMDLSQGFAEYERVQRASGSRLLPDIRRRARNLARDVGPLRYETYVTDLKVLERVLCWKTEQSQLTGTHQLFAHAWAREFAERLIAERTPSFAGVLSALWAGDRLVAGHLGMHSRSVWHYWFPAYDRSLAKYSPGLCLLLHMAEAAPSMGLTSIDFGKGEQRYKSSLQSAEVPLFEGRMFSGPMLKVAVQWMEHSADWLRATPLRQPGRHVARAARRLRDWAAYR